MPRQPVFPPSATQILRDELDRSATGVARQAGSLIASEMARTAGSVGALTDSLASANFRRIAGGLSLDQAAHGTLSGSLVDRAAQGSLAAMAATASASAASSSAAAHATVVHSSVGRTLPVHVATHEPRVAITTVADLGAAIRDARKRLKLTQGAFADLAGVGRRFVSELEAGKATIEFGKVLLCCTAAGIDLAATPRRQA